jgi:hypothetical protein
MPRNSHKAKKQKCIVSKLLTARARSRFRGEEATTIGRGFPFNLQAGSGRVHNEFFIRRRWIQVPAKELEVNLYRQLDQPRRSVSAQE